MRALLFFGCLFPLASFTQGLLVNGNFEEENICTEYQVNCAPEAWIYTVPSFTYYFKDSLLAHSGSHYVALIAGNSTKPFERTFVRTRLLCPLRKGKSYHIRFFIKSGYPVLDSMGAYFSSYDFLFERRPYQSIRASAYVAQAREKMSNDTGWHEVNLEYKASGDEYFMALGHFGASDLTGLAGTEEDENIVVAFDDVSLLPTDPREKLCDTWKKTQEAIYAQNERHEYLSRLIRINRGRPLRTDEMPKRVAPKKATLVIPDILFATNSFALSDKAHSLLDSFVHQSLRFKVDSLVVEGHTDSIGSFSLNDRLSQNRAASVSRYLQPYYSTHIQTRGWAYEKPVADNRTTSGRQMNRRVEIYLYIRQ